MGDLSRDQLLHRKSKPTRDEKEVDLVFPYSAENEEIVRSVRKASVTLQAIPHASEFLKLPQRILKL